MNLVMYWNQGRYGCFILNTIRVGLSMTISWIGENSVRRADLFFGSSMYS